MNDTHRDSFAMPHMSQESKRLWSWCDMIYIFRTGAFIEQFGALASEVSMMIFNRAVIDYDFEEHVRDQILPRLRAIRSGLRNIPLSPVLAAQWDHVEERLPTMTEENLEEARTLLVQLRSSIMVELNQPVFLVLDNSDASLFSQDDPFGDSVSALFPQATTDIYEGARCLALERYTAAVFHLMRAAEHALRYLGDQLGVQDIERKDFGQVVQESRDKFNAIRSREPRKEWIAEALASLDLFKDAWRNPVAHARNDQYTEQRARDVYNGTRAFMQSLTKAASATKEISE
jgi:hypothetical protein